MNLRLSPLLLVLPKSCRHLPSVKSFTEKKTKVRFSNVAGDGKETTWTGDISGLFNGLKNNKPRDSKLILASVCWRA